MKFIITVWDDAAKLEIETVHRRDQIGYFRDEVNAISAAFECTLIRSAILPELRKMLPECVIQFDYRKGECGKPVTDFSRATQVRTGPLGRRVVRRPGALAYDWMR